MKQRLLLSLLMLMVSVGVSWAQSYDIKVTFPANATKAITVSANVADDKALYGGAGSTTNNKVLTIPAEGNTSGAISITAAGATEITFGGEIQTIEINNDQLEVITASGVELQTLTLTNASKLKTLNVSNNNLTSLAVTGTAAPLLETLIASDNDLSSISSSLPTSLKVLDITNNGYRGSSENSGDTNYKWDLTSLTSLVELNIGGNTLLSVPTKDGVNVDKGIQDFTHKEYTDEILANQNLKLTDFANAIGMNNPAIIGASDWKKKTEGMDDPDAYGKTEDAQLVGNSKVDYLFYDSKGYYTDGKYECVLENADGYKYRVRMTVSPAEFKVKRNKLSYGAFIRALNNTGTNIFEYGEEPTVKQSEQLQVGVILPEGGHYEFDHFKNIKGLVLIDKNAEKDWTEVPDNVACKVAVKYNPNGYDETPYLDAEIKPAEYKVTFSQVEGGHISVYAQATDGTYTVPLANGAEVPYGSLIKIVVVPDNTTMEPTLVINEENQKLEAKEGSAEWILEYKIDDDAVITQNFGEATKVKVTAYVNNEKINDYASSGSPKRVRLHKGDETIILGLKEDGTSGVSSEKLVIGDTYQLSFDLRGDLDVKVIVGGEEIELTPSTYDAEPDEVITYTGTYTVPKSSPNIYITTIAWQEVKLVPTKAEGITEYVMYDGNTHEFHFTTNPTGLESKVKVEYKPEGNLQLANGLPQVAGTYAVKLSLPQGDGYSPVEEEYKLVIKKATPAFASIPSVKYNTTTQAYEYPDAEEGMFSVTPVNSSVDKTTTHLVKLMFTPDDVNNYNTITFIQEVSGTGDGAYRVPVEVINNNQNPTGVSIEVLNAGAVKANLNGSYLPNTELIILVTYPEGVLASDVAIDETLKPSGSSCLVYDTDRDNPSERIKAFKYTVPAVTEGKAETLQVNIDGVKNDKTYNVVLDKKQVVYNAARQAYFGMVKITDSKTGATLTPEYILTYVGVSGLPKDVNKYDVRVRIKAGNGYAAYDKTFEDAFEIIKATPKVNKWPTASPISIGQKLMFANLEGGEVSNVTGHFEWANKEYVPENNQEKCKVIFVPNDTNNYNTVDTGGSDDNDNDNNIPVTIVNERLVTYYSNFGESQIEIIVTDETGKTYKSGDVVEKGRVLTVATSAKNPDLELSQILVTNGENRQGNTFTVGEKSVEIEVVYQVKVPEVPEPEDPDEIIDPNSQYVVTVEKASKNNRGFILGKEGDNGVYYEDAFEFTVYALDEDLDKLVVNGATKIGKGKYRISSVTDNMTVTVSLPNPTQLDVKVVTESKNAKGYLVGKVKAESYPADGKCYYGDELVVVAYPVDGVSFSYWRDNALNKDQMREITVTKDMTIEAVFSGVPTGIEDIESAGIYAGKGYIQVKNVANADLTVVSISGRIQAQQHLEGDVQVRVPAGVYVVVLENGQDVKRVKVIVR